MYDTGYYATGEYATGYYMRDVERGSTTFDYKDPGVERRIRLDDEEVLFAVIAAFLEVTDRWR